MRGCFEKVHDPHDSKTLTKKSKLLRMAKIGLTQCSEFNSSVTVVDPVNDIVDNKGQRKHDT